LKIRFNDILSEENGRSNFSVVDRKVIKFLHGVYVTKYGTVDPLKQIMGDKYYGYNIQNLLYKSLIETLKISSYDHDVLSRFMAIFILNFREDGDYKKLNSNNLNDGLSDRSNEAKSVAKLINIHPFWVIESPYPTDKGFSYKAYKNIYRPANFASVKYENTHRFLVYGERDDIDSGEIIKFDASSILEREISDNINKLYEGEVSASRNALNLDDFVTLRDAHYRMGYNNLPRNEKRMLDSLFDQAIEYKVLNNYYEPNDVVQTLMNIGEDDLYEITEEGYNDAIEELQILENELKKIKIRLQKLYKEKGNISGGFDNNENNDDIDSEIYELNYQLDEITKEYEEKKYDYSDVIENFEKYNNEETLLEIVRDYVLRNAHESKLVEIAEYLSEYEYGYPGRGLSALLEKIPDIEFNVDKYTKESTTFGFQVERIMKGVLKHVEIGGNTYYILLRDFRDDRWKIEDYE
jgi:hypothetical protein